MPRIELQARTAKKTRSTAVAAFTILAVALLVPLPIVFLAKPNALELASLSAAYQVVSVFAAAGALGAVATTLWIQTKQASIAQRMAVRSGHIDVLKIAMDDPQTYLACFGIEDTAENRVWFKRRAFVTINLRRSHDLFKMNEMKEASIRNEVLAELFSSSFGLEYWRSVRKLWVDEEAGLPYGEAFVRIVDEEYDKALQRRRSQEAASQPGGSAA
jgi:uncharacterized protein DUF6082